MAGQIDAVYGTSVRIGASSIRDTLSRHYPIPEITTLQPFAQGLSNYNYKASTTQGDAVFVKVFRLADQAGIQREARLLEYLKQADIPAPIMIRTKTGACHAPVAGSLLVLYEYLDGSYPEANTEDAKDIGRLTAKLHRLPVPDFIHSTYKVSYAILAEQIKRQLRSINYSERRLLLHALVACECVASNDLPRGLVHTDLFLDNCIKVRSTGIYLLDFEESACDCFLLDLGRALLGCCSPDNCIDLEIAAQLLVGYSTLRALSPQEWDQLYHWLVYSILLSITWRFLEFNHNRPDEGKQDLYKTFLPSLESLLQLGKRNFLDQVHPRNTVTGNAEPETNPPVQPA